MCLVTFHHSSFQTAATAWTSCSQTEGGWIKLSDTVQVFDPRVRIQESVWPQPMLQCWSEQFIGIHAGSYHVMKVQTELNTDAHLTHPPLINCSFQTPHVPADSSLVRHSSVFLLLSCPNVTPDMSSRLSITVEVLWGGNITFRSLTDSYWVLTEKQSSQHTISCCR